MSTNLRDTRSKNKVRFPPHHLAEWSDERLQVMLYGTVVGEDNVEGKLWMKVQEGKIMKRASCG